MSERPKPRDRVLYLTESIDIGIISNLIKEIININIDDDEKENEFINWVREPIKLYIYSYGGVCYSGFALIDVIQKSKTPVHTIVLGCAMSMGLTIFMSGHKRLIGENAVLMYHDVAGGANMPPMKTPELKQNLDEALRIQSQGNKLILKESLVAQEMLQDYIKRKAEWYISAEEAISLKLAHEYYE